MLGKFYSWLRKERKKKRYKKNKLREDLIPFEKCSKYPYKFLPIKKPEVEITKEQREYLHKKFGYPLKDHKS